MGQVGIQEFSIIQGNNRWPRPKILFGIAMVYNKGITKGYELMSTSTVVLSTVLYSSLIIFIESIG